MKILMVLLLFSASLHAEHLFEDDIADNIIEERALEKKCVKVPQKPEPKEVIEVTPEMLKKALEKK